jgi:signal transduction histidine kinase
VNNPLGVVLLYANLVKDEADENSEFYQDLKMIAEQADRCKNIVGGLLNFARKNDVNYKTVDVHELVSSVLKSVIKPKGIVFEIDNRSEFSEAELDSEQIKQVLVNLVKNAVEACNKNVLCKVKVHIDGDEKELKIKVEDTGSGISPKNMDKLFVPFFTTKPAGKGTGLGLPVSYGIIKMHKGQITVVSNDDPNKGKVGTTFIITLPRKKP